MSSNLLLSGPPRIGKTTLIKKLIRELSGKPGISGFFTEEIKKGGRREGFKIITLEGKEEVFAHYSLPTRYRVGKYGVDVSKFERLGVSILEEALAKKDTKVLLIDEIGKMELMSEKFKNIVVKAFESSNTVVASIGIQKDLFTEALRKRSDTKIIKVTKENRDSLPETLIKLLHQAVS